jgi:hypothetical protein
MSFKQFENNPLNINREIKKYKFFIGDSKDHNIIIAYYFINDNYTFKASTRNVYICLWYFDTNKFLFCHFMDCTEIPQPI